MCIIISGSTTALEPSTEKQATVNAPLHVPSKAHDLVSRVLSSLITSVNQKSDGKLSSIIIVL